MRRPMETVLFTWDNLKDVLKYGTYVVHVALEVAGILFQDEGTDHQRTVALANGTYEQQYIPANTYNIIAVVINTILYSHVYALLRSRSMFSIYISWDKLTFCRLYMRQNRWIFHRTRCYLPRKSTVSTPTAVTTI